MRIMLSLVLLLAAAAINGCSGSSSAQSPRGGEFALPVGVIIDFAPLSNRRLLLNTQTDTNQGSFFDVWTHDLSTGNSALLVEDATGLLREDVENVWHGQTFLATPADTGSSSCAIMITDGTPEGTRLLVDLSSDSSISFQRRDVHLVGDQLVINISEYDANSDQFNPYLVVVNLDEV